ncbi:MAG: hypothetical protein IT291_01150, partial [Deltaproteobacteria bacterium]|nr:hypothetical protein [Deltaproteobacteria bacterium]
MGLGNFFNSNDRRTRAFDERGSVIVFVALLIGVMVGVVGLVVDHSRHAVTALHLKTVADAASLAASRKLDGTHDGWRQAKRAAVAVLRQSKIYGVGNISFESASFNDGVDDPYEDSANYKATKMRVGDVALTIERGAWWYEVDEHKDDAGQQKFFSFEGLKEVNDFPPYALANAAQVSLELAEMDLTFAKVFGQSKIGTTARVSTAISDNEVQEVCVLPIAIKDCMLRMAPGAKDDGFMYDEFHAEKQCSREVATKVGMQEMPQLEEGARLAESYVLRTVPESSSAGKLPERDNKMVNIEAVFGLPTTNFQSSKA